jgi:hypothetical protein
MGQKHAQRPVVVEPEQEDFSDPESERVLKAAMFALIDVLAREAADDYINEHLRRRPQP